MVYVFIINMAEKRPDRRQHMVQLMADMDMIHYEFVEPVKATGNNNVTAGNMSLRNTLLHVIFPKAMALQVGNFIVFEDDLMTLFPKESIKNEIETILQEACNSSWDMIYLEYCVEACFLGAQVSQRLQKAVNPMCSAAIIFNSNNLQNVTNCVALHESVMSFVYSHCIRNGQINAFVTKQPLFAQDARFQGDMNHRGFVHHVLSHLFNIYRNTIDEDDKPTQRLPHCFDSFQTFKHLTLLFWILLLLLCIIGVYFVLRIQKK